MMKMKLIDDPKGKVAVVQSSELVMASAQDALDLMATLRYEHDCNMLVIPKTCIAEQFFDLKTGMAGEILQKYTNYHVKIAIVGDFSGYTSKALRDFIYESNKGSTTFFLPDEKTAIEALLNS